MHIHIHTLTHIHIHIDYIVYCSRYYIYRTSFTGNNNVILPYSPLNGSTEYNIYIYIYIYIYTYIDTDIDVL